MVGPNKGMVTTGSADFTLDISSSTAVTTVNASAMTGKFTFVADGKTTGTTVTGGSGDDILTADGSNDVLIGGAGADTLTATALTTLTGGEGNDKFVMAGAIDSTVYSTITDLTAGDVINTVSATAFASSKVSLAANSTFAQYLDAAIVAAVAGSTTSGASWFQFNGDTFIVVEGDTTGGNTYDTTEDSVIAITGLKDLSTSVFNASTFELTIA